MNAANIAFAQSPPGIGRKRPSLPGQLPGDRASAVPLQLPQMRPVRSKAKFKNSFGVQVNKEQAIEALRFHSGSDQRTDDPRWQSGFLGSLRPFSGLQERNFHEVMACIRVLSLELQGSSVSRDLMNSLWGILFYGHLWGVAPDGMLRRNGLISENEVLLLSDWLERIGFAVSFCLDRVDAAALEADEINYLPPVDWNHVWKTA